MIVLKRDFTSHSLSLHLPRQLLSNEVFPKRFQYFRGYEKMETVSGIPVVDFAAMSIEHETLPSPSDGRVQAIARQIHEAFSTVGFVYLRNHGITQQKVIMQPEPSALQNPPLGIINLLVNIQYFGCKEKNLDRQQNSRDRLRSFCSYSSSQTLIAFNATLAVHIIAP